MRILVVEDDVETSGYIERGLTSIGHKVVCTDNGRDGLTRVSSEPLDLVILDRMLPEIDGISILRDLRANDATVPVLLLTALDSIQNRVEGLDAGADDYLGKPFSLEELAARVNALGRRTHASNGQVHLRAGGITIDRLARVVTRASKVVDLQPREFKLLEELVLNAGRVVTRKMLLERVWNFHFDPRTNIVETHVSRLRSKLNEGFAQDPITTVRGEGYTIAVDE